MRTLLAGIIVAVIMVSAPVALAAGSAANKEPYYVLNYLGSKVEATIKLNGATVATIDTGYATGFSNINQWIIPGKNTVDVVLASKIVDGAAGDSMKAEFNFSISEAKKGQHSDEGKKIVKYALKGQKIKDTPMKFSKTFTVKYAPPGEFLPQAKTIKIDEEAKKAVVQLMNKLTAAINENKTNELVELFTYKVAESTLVNYYPADPERTLKYVGSLQGAKAESAKAGELVWTLVAGKKIISVTKKDGSAPLIITYPAEPESGSGEMPLYAAPVKGVWILVR